jgi:hypothetical protein
VAPAAPSPPQIDQDEAAETGAAANGQGANKRRKRRRSRSRDAQNGADEAADEGAAPEPESPEPERLAALETRGSAREPNQARAAQKPAPEPSDSAEDVPEARPELPDMTTLYLNVGKRDGLEGPDVSALLASAAQLENDDIGRIHIKERHTFVGVPSERTEFVISALTGLTIKNRALHVERART